MRRKKLYAQRSHWGGSGEGSAPRRHLDDLRMLPESWKMSSRQSSIDWASAVMVGSRVRNPDRRVGS
jgi:hypothetical protein